MDLCIRVDFLTGRYIATDAFNRAGHEWPAHPNRLFSASVAALHDQDEVNDLERQALQWLETLGDPSIHASDATARSVSTHFVPTNDASIVSTSQLANRYQRLGQALDAFNRAPSDAKRAAAAKKITKERDVTKMVAWDETGAKADVLPEERGKQARFYPSVSPEEPTQWFIWNDVDEKLAAHHRQALDQVLGRISRLGHSSSFVAVSLDECDRQPNWVPDRHGTHTLRTIEPGQLERLEQDFNERATHVLGDRAGSEWFSDTNPRIMPNRLTRYRRGDDARETDVVGANESGEWLLFEYVSGKRFPVSQTWQVCRAFRSALLAHAPDPSNSYLSGHEPDGRPTTASHIKVIAPSHVAGKYANGLVMGIALILPEASRDEDKLNVYRAIARWEQAVNPEDGKGPVHLFTNNGDTVCFQRVLRPERKTMVPETWSRPASQWTTVTPIALDRNPKSFGHANNEKHEKAVQRINNCIAQACVDQGLPIPDAIEVSRQPFLKESRDAKAFGAVVSGERERFLIHARITFPVRVIGPVVLGAGRFFGMGLCLPGGAS